MMVRSTILTVCLLLFVTATGVPAASKAAKSMLKKEKYYIAKVSGRDKSLSYDLYSEDDYKKLEEQIKLEARYHSRALAAAMKEWKADEKYKGENFPRSAIAIRKMSRAGSPYTNRDDAQSKLDRYLEDEDIRQQVLEQRAKERNARRSASTPSFQSNDPRAKIKAQQEKKKLEEEAKRKAAAEQAILDAARDLYANKLNELIAEAKKRAAGAAK